MFVIWESLKAGTCIKMRQIATTFNVKVLLKLCMALYALQIWWLSLFVLCIYLPRTCPWPLNTYTKAAKASKWKDIMYVPIVFWWFWISRNIKRQGQLKTEKFFCVLSFNCFLTIGSNSLGLINTIYVVNLWKAWKECRWYCYFKVWIMIWSMQ